MAKLISDINLLKICATILLLSTNNFRAFGAPIEKGGARALFIFGDSTLDPGNNNYIDTIPEYRANYKPYGQNGFFAEPTGRFSNGRVIVDYIGT